MTALLLPRQKKKERKEVIRHIGHKDNGRLMTPEEFDAVEEFEEGWVYELVRGVLVVMPTPLPMERGPNETLGHWLLNYQEQHPQGAALDATLPEEEVRPPNSRRRADRAIWAGLGRVPDTRSDEATILVEFVSESTRDRRRDYESKREEYLALGVKEYWIIDRFRRNMTVCRAEKPDRLVRESQNYRSPLLPGFELPLGKLLAVADRWEKARE